MKKYINPYNLFVGSFIPNWLLRRSEISPGAKLCYARLAQYAGRDGECFPSQDTLAAEIGAGERQARRYLSELENCGLIETVQLGLHQSNRYRFLAHPWMEGIKKEPPGNGGRKKTTPDRSHMTAQDRTDTTGQERLKKTAKENQTRDSQEKTTTKRGVVEENDMKRLRNALAPAYAEIQDSVLERIVEEKGIDHALSIAHQTAYQLEHGSTPPKNPSGHFIRLATGVMNVPHGYESPGARKEKEEAARLKSVLSAKKRELGRQDLIPLGEIQKFIKDF